MLRIALALTSLLGTVSTLSTVNQCKTVDQPNPIAELYPYNVTGVLNSTLAVIPVPFALARNLLNSIGLTILESAVEAVLPVSFPKDSYPVLVQTAHDHDIQVTGFGVSDFSVGYPRKRSSFSNPSLYHINPVNSEIARWLRVPIHRPSCRRKDAVPLGPRTTNLGHQRRGHCWL